MGGGDSNNNITINKNRRAITMGAEAEAQESWRRLLLKMIAVPMGQRYASSATSTSTFPFSRIKGKHLRSIGLHNNKGKISEGKYGKVYDIPESIQSTSDRKVCMKVSKIKKSNLILQGMVQTEAKINALTSRLHETGVSPHYLTYYEMLMHESRDHYTFITFMERADYLFKDYIEHFVLGGETETVVGEGKKATKAKAAIISKREGLILSALFQIYHALYVGQIRLRLSHQDLHDSNIMLKLFQGEQDSKVFRDFTINECALATHFRYKVVGKDNKGVFFYLPNPGFFIKIIDWGFATARPTPKAGTITPDFSQFKNTNQRQAPLLSSYISKQYKFENVLDHRLGPEFSRITCALKSSRSARGFLLGVYNGEDLFKEYRDEPKGKNVRVIDLS